MGSEIIILLEFKPNNDIINYSILCYIVNANVKSTDYIFKITPMPTICVDNCFAVHTVTQVENAIKAIFQVSRCVLLLNDITENETNRLESVLQFLQLFLELYCSIILRQEYESVFFVFAVFTISASI